jgi:hypothetical protein
VPLSGDPTFVSTVDCPLLKPLMGLNGVRLLENFNYPLLGSIFDWVNNVF